MKLPRDVSGERLVRMLARHGYSVARQKGSHVRLEYRGVPSHGITVPLHTPVKLGTLHSILSEVAERRAIAFAVLLEDLT